MIPGADLIIGLFIRILAWICVATVRWTARTLWSALTDHPGIVFVLLNAAAQYGWITSTWTPFALLVLAGLTIVRLLSVHPPRQIAQTVRVELERTGRYVGAVGKVRERLHRKPRLPAGLDPVEVP